jgi:hypothetical protein
MYSPRSESNLGWSKEEDYRHGYGDPEQMEIARDEKQAEQEKTTMVDDLPHLQISIPEPEPPMMPPMMPPMEEEEEEMMPSVANPMGADLSAMTGMPDTGNLSIGNAIGTMPAPGGMLATGEPMSDAWSSLMKEDDKWEVAPYDEWEGVNNTALYPPVPRVLFGRPNQLRKPIQVDPVSEQSYPFALDSNEQLNYAEQFAEPISRIGIEIRDEQLRRKLDTNNRHPDMSVAGFSPSFQDIYTGEPMDDAWSSLMKARLDKVKGGEDKSWKQPQYETQPGGSDITTGTSRRAKLQSRFLQPQKKRGIDQAPLSVHRTHLGVETKQPLRMFPEKYGHQMATQARRKLMGNIPQTPAGHGVGAERSYSPKAPKSAPSGGLPLTEPRTPMERGKSFAKSVKEDVEEVKKKMDYLHFAQIRRLLRRLKDATERQERRLKSKDQSGPGEKGEAGHREAQNSTTRPEGATEDMENDPKNWGAPSTMFVGRGSGRIG